MSAIACPACGQPMELFRNKAGKPYASCRPCGAQFFIRNQAGVVAFSARHPDEWRTAPVMGAAPTNPSPDVDEPAPVIEQPATDVKPEKKSPAKKGGSRATFFG